MLSGALAPTRRTAFVDCCDVGGPAETSFGAFPVPGSTPFPARPSLLLRHSAQPKAVGHGQRHLRPPVEDKRHSQCQPVLVPPPCSNTGGIQLGASHRH